jgi:hypothetical protein
MVGATFAFTGRECTRRAVISGNLELHDFFFLTISLEKVTQLLSFRYHSHKKFILSPYIYSSVHQCLLPSIDITSQLLAFPYLLLFLTYLLASALLSSDA